MQVHRIAKGVLLFVGSLTVLSGAIIAPSLPLIAEHLSRQGLDSEYAAFWVKMLLSIPALVILLCSPLMGYVIDRFGRRKVILTGLCLFAISGVWSGIYPSLSILVLSRIGLGVAVAMSMTTAITLISDYLEGPEREQFMGYFSSALSIGGMVYFILGGFVAMLSWRAPFFIYLLGIPAFFLAYCHLPEPMLEKPQQLSQDSNNKEKLPLALVGVLYLTALFLMAIYFIIPTQLPFILGESGFKKPFHVGLTTACCSLAVTIAAMNFGWLKQKFSDPALFTVGFLCIAVGYGIIYLDNHYVSIVLGLFSAGLGFGCVMPNVGTWLMRIASPSMRGRLSGGLSSSINMGQFLSPLIATFAISFGATINAFGFFASVSFVIALLYGVYSIICASYLQNKL